MACVPWTGRRDRAAMGRSRDEWTAMKFVQVIGGWINRYFANEEAIFLVVFLTAALLILIFFGAVLAPILTGLAFAFLLRGVVARLVVWRVPRLVAVGLVELLFLGVLTALVIVILPLVWQQLRDLLNALPGFLEQLRDLASELPQRYPEFFSETTASGWIGALNQQVVDFGADLVQDVVALLSNVLGLMLFFVLTPVALFFFLKDSDRMLAAVASVLPRKRRLLNEVGGEMSLQIGNYLRGKLIEIVIVGMVTYLTFWFLDVNYAALLGLVVGVSVLIPFVGAIVVTIPVATVGLLQFGWSVDFLVLMVAYLVIQGLDGNVLVPLLFSEVVDLHPVAIIVAVLVFGALWGFWGVFFAIPLATLVKAVFHAWPAQDAPEAGVVE